MINITVELDFEVDLIYVYIVLSNPERKKHYDRYGTVADDEEGEEAFFREFEEMFFGGGMFGSGGDDFDDFMEFLESDTKFMRGMFRDLGKNARLGKGKRAGRKVGKGGPDMDDIMTMFMMPGMMGMGMGMGMNLGGTKKNKKKQ